MRGPIEKARNEKENTLGSILTVQYSKVSVVTVAIPVRNTWNSENNAQWIYFILLCFYIATVHKDILLLNVR